jgi:hypothetical protein
MKIVLSAVEAPLADAWQRFCGHLECVTIHRGSILDLEVDAVVSPANSFGFMDGGIDGLYSSFFGWHVQDRLQKLTRAALLLIKFGVFAAGALAGEPVSRGVQAVAFPGLVTGVGQVGPNTCARQVAAAIEEVVLGGGGFPVTWADAQARHQLLYTDRVRDLQRE